MSPYRKEDAVEKENFPVAKNKYPPDKETEQEKHSYDKRMNRRLSIQEFVAKYKIDKDVDKS